MPGISGNLRAFPRARRRSFIPLLILLLTLSLPSLSIHYRA